VQALGLYWSKAKRSRAGAVVVVQGVEGKDGLSAEQRRGVLETVLRKRRLIERCDGRVGIRNR